MLITNLMNKHELLKKKKFLKIFILLKKNDKKNSNCY